MNDVHMTGGLMSKESMLKIKEAEDRAVALVEAARADARARVEAAEREGAWWM